MFVYSGKTEDVGNNGSTIDIRAGRFALNMRFVVDQLYRVLAPGCNACIHIQQLLAHKNQHGFMGRRDFRGAMVDVFRAGGLQHIGEFTIQKNPQVMAQKLNLHSLQFATAYKRSATNLAPCPNDYVLIFQKPGQVEHPVRCLRDKRGRNPGGWLTEDEWIRDAHGIWTDILEIDCLGVGGTKEAEHEKHVCPLQREVIRRCVALYTNPLEIQPDVTVLDPFMGIGSTAWVCLRGSCNTPDGVKRLHACRNVVGFELKDSYYRTSLANIERARKALEKAPEANMFAGVE